MAAGDDEDTVVGVRAPRRPMGLPTDGSVGLVVLFLLGAVAALARGVWEPRLADGLPIEVTGQVARPGLHLVSPATLAAAIEAAGGVSDGVAETPLHAGDAVEVLPEGARIVRADQPMLAGLRLDPAVDGSALVALPGLGEQGAVALVGAAAAAEPRAVERAVRRLRPVERDAVVLPKPRPSGPIDLNTADARALERLPGVGPALAAKIIADREAKGPFRRVDDLDRVSGIGPATVERLRAQAVVTP